VIAPAQPTALHGLGAGVLDDQASRLRALASAARAPAPVEEELPGPRARVIAIASGKGGVGKTTLAVNLSIAAAEAGRRVALVDADLGCANADLMLGVTPERHLGHVIEGRCGLERALCQVQRGLSLLAGASGMAGLAALDRAGRARLLSAIEVLERRSEVIVLDCGAGIGPGVLDLVLCADDVVVVTTPEPTSLADAYGLIKSAAIRRETERPTLWSLVNACAGAGEAQAVHERLGSVCERFLGWPVRVGGSVQADPAAGRAVRARRPLLHREPNSIAGKDIRVIAARLGLRDALERGPASAGMGVPGAGRGNGSGAGGGLLARLLRINRIR
jgi:flagellar biosynthesis protein FlhG